MFSKAVCSFFSLSISLGLDSDIIYTICVYYSKSRLLTVWTVAIHPFEPVSKRPQTKRNERPPQQRYNMHCNDFVTFVTHPEDGMRSLSKLEPFPAFIAPQGSPFVAFILHEFIELLVGHQVLTCLKRWYAKNKIKLLHKIMIK